jgi:hypothetical protein
MHVVAFAPFIVIANQTSTSSPAVEPVFEVVPASGNCLWKPPDNHFDDEIVKDFLFPDQLNRSHLLHYRQYCL